MCGWIGDKVDQLVLKSVVRWVFGCVGCWVCGSFGVWVVLLVGGCVLFCL